MSKEKDAELLAEAKKEIDRLKLALTNAAAIEQTYLKFGPIFDELFGKVQVLEKKLVQIEAQVSNHQNMIVKALQDKYRGGTT